MKDLDFDELDKAVSSLMSDASKNLKDVPQPTPEGAKDTVMTIKETLPSKPAMTPATMPTPPAQSTIPASEKKEASPSLATKRRGRFMDVVHPSSDMRAGETASSTVASVSRNGATIQPSASVVAPSQPEENPLEEKPASTPQANPTPAATSDWPDPIDMHQQQTVSESEANNDKPAADVATTLPAPQAVPPLESPFLPDAKVEKRPLGGSVSEQSEDKTLQPNLEEPETTEATPAESAEKNDEVPVAPLPAELHGDVLSVEANEPSPMEVVEETKEKKPKADHAKSDSGHSEKIMASSIAQQYKEQPSTGDQSHTAIYDTANYQEPLAHPAKKKSGWLWVVWIVLLILAGAGGAAALYFLKII